jgi:REP element-mobilizing transposase RayT
MPQSLSKVLLHLVFSTKNRGDLIPDSVEGDLHAYLAGACRGQGAEAFRAGGTANHVHIACTLPRTLTVSKLVQEIKQASSAWIKTQDPACAGFQWQAGYGAFSLGQSQLPSLVRYIERQKEHHARTTFKEELLALIRKYGVAFDERYIWD